MNLRLRPLAEADLPRLQALIAADPGFSERTNGRPPSADAADDAAELLSAAPPGVAAHRKTVLGAFDTDDNLVAVIDLIRGWPQPDTALIGLLQVHADKKGAGIGRTVHALLLDRLPSWPEITQLRAAIVETNAAHAEPFWSAMGYARAGAPKPYRTGDLDTTVTIWTRPAGDAR